MSESKPFLSLIRFNGSFGAALLVRRPFRGWFALSVIGRIVRYATEQEARDAMSKIIKENYAP
jgi:hypothetical protein